MIYSPVIIPTLCRYEKFVMCVESLKKNTFAQYTDVFIGLDYPKKEEHFEGYSLIKQYLQNEFSEFHSFTVIYHKENIGSSRNSLMLKQMVLDKYDRYIRTDDDCVFSPYFLEYMDICLEEFKDDDRIVAVNGYSFPLEWKVKNDCIAFLSNFECSTWGTGFWKGKSTSVIEKIKNGFLVTNFETVSQNKNYKLLCKKRFIDYVRAGLGRDKGFLTKGTDIAISLYLGYENKFVVMPRLSFVRNYGFDGSGENCVNSKSDKIRVQNNLNYNYDFQPICEYKPLSYMVDINTNCRENLKVFNRFYRPKFGTFILSKCQFLFFLMFGKNAYSTIRNILNK